MGIPHKLASRGVRVIPLDFLPIRQLESKRHMYWGMGQRILQGARLVKENDQLFGTYITNFSCGPDSFIIGYFREILGRKPSLTLELDSHTADAGIETRIEAFLDIVSEYRQLLIGTTQRSAPRRFTPAQMRKVNRRVNVITSSGEEVRLDDPRVTLVIPSMGRLTTELLGAVLRGAGFKVVVLPPADESILKVGRAQASCKECLPLIITAGGLLDYANAKRRDDEIVVYFMASASGPCRFGQYAVFMQDVVRRLKIPDVAVMCLTSENSYWDVEGSFSYRKAWTAIVISDFLEDARSMILANAVDPEQGLAVFEDEWRAILEVMEHGTMRQVRERVEQTAATLGRIPMKRAPREVPLVLLAGEIFVRRDGISRRYLTERLAEKGFAVLCAPISEWVHYVEYDLKINPDTVSRSSVERFKFYLRNKMLESYERRFTNLLGRSGLVQTRLSDVATVVENARRYLNPQFSSEAVLTVGSAITEIATKVAGVIIIGPFGCMPNRVSESILTEVMTPADKLGVSAAASGNGRNGHNRSDELQTVLDGMEHLPFLSIETDGSPYPQLIEAKLEAFCLQAQRLHDRMLRHRGTPCLQNRRQQVTSCDSAVPRQVE